MKQRIPTLEEYVNESFINEDNKDIRLLDKGDKIEFVVPGTTNEVGEETVIDRISNKNEDFAVVMHKGKKINVPFNHISYIVEKQLIVDFMKLAEEYLKGENVFNTHALGIRDFAKYLNNRKNDL